jgi:hypothetical protein
LLLRRDLGDKTSHKRRTVSFLVVQITAAVRLAWKEGLAESVVSQLELVMGFGLSENTVIEGLVALADDSTATQGDGAHYKEYGRE